MKKVLVCLLVVLLTAIDAQAGETSVCEVDNCKKCRVNRSRYCEICNDGYLPYAGESVPLADGGAYAAERCAKSDIKRCVYAANSQGDCWSCEDGYAPSLPDRRECVPCKDKNAEVCKDGGSTTVFCKTGYTLKEGVCKDDNSQKLGSVISCPDDMRLSADGCCCLTE